MEKLGHSQLREICCADHRANDAGGRNRSDPRVERIQKIERAIGRLGHQRGPLHDRAQRRTAVASITISAISRNCGQHAMRVDLAEPRIAAIGYKQITRRVQRDSAVVIDTLAHQVGLHGGHVAGECGYSCARDERRCTARDLQKIALAR